MGAHAFGQPVLRREDTRLLRGTGRFLADLVPGDAARAVMLRSPHAHATIGRIDAAAARAMPGVLAVLTGEDWAADGLGAIPAGHDFPTLPRTPNRGAYQHRPQRPALARDRVRFVGDTVAMVVAETETLARDAAECVAIDYEPLPCVTDTEAAVRPGAPAIWAEAADNVCFRWEAGDADAVAAAFARAARVVRVSLRNNRVHVGAIETRGAIGAFADGRFTLTTGSQMPHALRDALAHDVLRVVPESGARDRRRCRRQLRDQERALSRAGAGAVGGAAARANGRLDRGTERRIPLRLSGARQREHRVSGAGCRGAVPGAPGRDGCEYRRLSLARGMALAHDQHPRVGRRLSAAGDPCVGDGGVQPHGSGRGLSRRRAAGGGASAGAARRRSRGRDRDRARFTAPAQLAATGRPAVSDGPWAAL